MAVVYGVVGFYSKFQLVTILPEAAFYLLPTSTTLDFCSAILFRYIEALNSCAIPVKMSGRFKCRMRVFPSWSIHFTFSGSRPLQIIQL